MTRFSKKIFIELSAVQSTQKHSTLTLAYSDLLHATTCFGHLLWPSTVNNKMQA